MRKIKDTKKKVEINVNPDKVLITNKFKIK